MHSDQIDQYRSILEANSPDFIDRVDTPWDEVPDFPDYNAAAYRHIVRDLDRLRRATKGDKPSSRGILVLGESGTGKTHLLMRVARNLAKANHISFVRRPNDEESVAQHVWANIVSSLARKLPTSGETRSQLDDLLAHVFSTVLIPEFEQDVKDGKDAAKKRRWVELLKEDPYNLSQMIGEGEGRTANMRNIRSRTLRYLQRVHPEADQQIAHALISYCFVSNETRRRVVLTWLSGQDIDERESQAMGLPSSWVAVDDTSSDTSIQQRREEQALRAIQTIGILSIYYQPLILAFDQLEGLRHEEGLTRRWGDVVREIFTMAPNFLIVTCTFPSPLGIMVSASTGCQCQPTHFAAASLAGTFQASARRATLGETDGSRVQKASASDTHLSVYRRGCRRSLLSSDLAKAIHTARSDNFRRLVGHEYSVIRPVTASGIINQTDVETSSEMQSPSLKRSNEKRMLRRSPRNRTCLAEFGALSGPFSASQQFTTKPSGDTMSYH